MRNWACLVLILLVVGVVLSAKPLATLTESDLKDAIAWGETGTARPYPLTAKFNNDLEAGLVYTPFIRVALAAARAKAAGETLQQGKIPASLTAPVIHIVMWRLRIPPDPALQVLQTGGPRIELGEFPERKSNIPPLWTSNDIAIIGNLDAALLRHEVEVVAAFSIDVIGPERDILCYRRVMRPPGHVGRNIVTGVMRAAITNTEWSLWR